MFCDHRVMHILGSYKRCSQSPFITYSFWDIRPSTWNRFSSYCTHSNTLMMSFCTKGSKAYRVWSSPTKFGDSTSRRSCVIRPSCYITRQLNEFSVSNNVFSRVLMCVLLVNLFLTRAYIACSFSIGHFVSLTIFVRNQELIVLKQVFVKVCNLCDF